MKEVTRVITCEVTTIAMIKDDDPVSVERMKAYYADELISVIENDGGADNVNIVKDQIFIRDVPDQVSAQ